MKTFSLKTHAEQTGAALIMALIIVAVVAMIATNLILRSQIDINRTSLVIGSQQVSLDNTYALAWAQNTYSKDLYSDPNQPQAAPQDTAPFPLLMPGYQTDNATIDASLMSAQGFFNLNNLSNASYLPIFAKLIQLVDSHYDDKTSLNIANATAYFINSGIDPTQDKIYLAFTPAYRPSHRLFVSASELRLVDGMTAKLYQELSPYIIALPTVTSLDPNSASKPVLMAYGLSSGGADSVLAARQTKRFQTIADFNQAAQLQSATTNSNAGNLFGLKYQYLFLTTTVTQGSNKQIIYNILQTGKSNDKLVLLQQFRNNL